VIPARSVAPTPQCAKNSNDEARERARASDFSQPKNGACGILESSLIRVGELG
jgi:hypothetical protein